MLNNVLFIISVLIMTTAIFNKLPIEFLYYGLWRAKLRLFYMFWRNANWNALSSKTFAIFTNFSILWTLYNFSKLYKYLKNVGKHKLNIYSLKFLKINSKQGSAFTCYRQTVIYFYVFCNNKNTQSVGKKNSTRLAKQLLPKLEHYYYIKFTNIYSYSVRHCE